ncbi:hypothetical protein MA16_Dca000492 [Dendrobium catenatum]|uniref:Uncharacterized protein n=2 Tax=Dendrobium catenatum TaxID=906689 RepID=A0A2I0WU08_9ASPA|nr:hypothetical protein MA16_Dca000492 [Dendrobium catenatum]
MGEKVGRGGGAVMADELGEGMQCSDHPYRNNPGGICAFCLQEKLGKLVSSSKFSDPFFSIPPPPSSSSSPPSFPSSDLPALPSSNRMSFLSSKHRRRKMKTHSPTNAAAADRNAESATLNRSKSVVPRPRGEIADASDSPRKKSFWSFLTLTYSSSTSSAPIPTSFISKRRSTSSASSSSAVAGNCVSEIPKVAKDDEVSAGNDDASPSGSQASSSFGRKVARSRSVGCGSRSFSGDFLERISNGFGDCTLRRVESHRESKQKVSIHRGDRHEDDDDEQRIKERIKCGGIFVGLGMTTYWLSATAAADACGDTVPLPAARRASAPHGRNKSWGWAFASPMRAFRPGGGGGGGGGHTTIIATGGDTAGGNRIHRCYTFTNTSISPFFTASAVYWAA